MRLNADFDQRAVIRPDDYQWVPSPMPGVERMMLDRIGDEVARATSLVRYAPNSTFSPHTHGGGEEFLVLDGEFGDEHELYPAGTYVRNPIGTSHSPRVGEQGCTIFVKLHQFDAEDRRQFAVDTNSVTWEPGSIPGVEMIVLHEFGSERVELVRIAADTQFPMHAHEGGEEILVLDGTLWDEEGEYPAGSWVRNPDGSEHAPYSKSDGALLYVKFGHLGGQIISPVAE